MTVGMLLIAVQLLYFSTLDESSTFWNLLPAFLVGGVGMALTMTPSAAAATRSVPVDKAGVGSAVLNAARQVGGAMGIAIMGAIVAHAASGSRPPLGAQLSAAQEAAVKAAFIDGFQSALLVAAVIAAAGAVVAFVLVRPHEREEPARHETVERAAA
jgi:MFS family permease